MSELWSEWQDPNDEHTTISVHITPTGVSWSGDLWAPHGGPYTIGFQTFEAFLQKGPMEPMSVSAEAALRAEVTQRLEDPQGHLKVEVVAVADVDCQQVSLSLDEDWLGLLQEQRLEAGRSVVLFEGSISSPQCAMSSAVCWHEDGTIKRVYPKHSFDLGKDKRVWIRLIVDGEASRFELGGSPQGGPQT